MEEVDPPSGWNRLNTGDRESNSEQFEGGFECAIGIGEAERGDEVLVWSGDGDIQSHLGNQVPSDAEFRVEIREDNRLVKEQFSSTRNEAVEKTHREVFALHNGE